ncbi:hypothetical protein BKA67DRAFT_658834 [Truncatella angustata]|uniref:Myb-like domain-containing protein n=1 Tax=Truncatella angustata TaxID=152316 RepID=A0A9P8ZY13_9PEZI|nr:uncharacterized protein BKA67DRAFT_658834 [Truncatella angustata]KAH6654544.1 hypothetical protein BKA67DRAFT_658834 [Truncatella angustata]
MFIKQEQPVLHNRYVCNDQSLWSGQEHFTTNIDQVHDSFQEPATVRFQLQLRQHQQGTRKFEPQHPHYHQLDQHTTQQGIVSWAQELSHHLQVQGCHPQYHTFPKQQHTQFIASQVLQPQRESIKMEDGRNFPQNVGNDQTSWQFGDTYERDFIDLPVYSPSNNGTHQTTGGYHVSGRHLGPSHSHNNHQHQINKGGMGTNSSHQRTWPTFQATYADTYSPPPFAPIESEFPRQQSMPAIFGDPSSTNYMGMHRGLPSNGWAIDSSVPVLGNTVQANDQASPLGTTYSRFASSPTSRASTSARLNAPMETHRATVVGMMSYPTTISPEVLRIDRSPAPTSSSEPAHLSFFPTSDRVISRAASFEQQHLAPESSSTRRVNAKGRTALPEKPFPTTNYTSAQAAAFFHQRGANENSTPHSRSLPNIKPKPPRVSVSASPDPGDAGLTAEELERNRHNEYLVQAKRAGKTYREIKLEGGFTEAESTLRGRYRTLTKDPVDRVRKPEWTRKDVELLKEAVQKLIKGASPKSTKIPWKQVSAYIAQNGGSYNFGYSTCSKRWDELVMQNT